MRKTELTFPDGDYTPVADRIRLFYDRFPFGRIITHLVVRTEHEVVFRAEVFRGDDDEVAATGWAAEREGDGEVNTVACLENTETSAVGRALANLGLTASRNRPSAMGIRKRRPRTPSAGEQATDDMPPSVPASAALRPDCADDPLEEAADAVVDALAVLAEAQRAGFDVTRAAEFRDALLAPDAPPSAVTRTERAARRWLAGIGEEWPGTSTPLPRDPLD